MELRTYPRMYHELLASAFTLIMGTSLSAVFLPLFAKELDPSGLLVGAVTSAWFISRILTDLPSGILADRLGRRKLLVGGLVLSAFGALLCSAANIIHILIVGRMFWGLGTGLFFMSCSATIFDLFRSSVRGRALGTFQALEFIGSFIGAPIGGFMVAFIDYNGVFLIASALIVCSLIIALLSIGLKKTEEKSVGQAGVPIKDVLSSLRRGGLAAICINSFSRMFILSGLMSTVFPLYLNLELGISVELIGLIVCLRTLGVITATAVSGALSDKYGRKPIVALGILIQIVCFYAYTLTSMLEVFLLIGLIEGLSRGMVITSMMVLLSEAVSPQIRGGAIGMYRTFMDMGGFAGPLAFMLILEHLGSYSTFFSAIILLSVNAILILTIRESHKAEEQIRNLPAGS